MVLLLIVMRDR